MNAPIVTIRRIDLFERPVVLRLPFRFGAATVTRCPQAFVRVEAEVDGRSLIGASAELMVPKWFDKSPALTHEQNFEQLRAALRWARSALLGQRGNAWTLSHEHGDEAIRTAVANGLPRLAAQFGPAQIDKAIADIALRALDVGWCEGVASGALGDPWSGQAGIVTPQTVWLRHTVGLADRLSATDPGADPEDGLPATLSDAITRYGLRRFKLKLSGRIDDDIERLQRIAALLDGQAGDYRATLDGNESFADVDALAAFWRRFSTTPSLQAMHRRLLLLEQPLPRAVALQTPIASLGIDVPVILDESDDHDEALEQGLAIGYRGISSKACKGIYRSLHSAATLRGRAGLLLSGEDLTCQAGLAVQQDTLLAASLGVADIERNGHHYVDGFGSAPAAEAEAFADAHPGFYERAANGRIRLRVSDGRLDLGSLHRPGFARSTEPMWADLSPIH
ncbi:hypothetical protein [Piscinibacter sakaiensis]|uniref:hypothetical protein n=1 Tax=Piscinibacter sakaiensis TaxID=1547922 RepID=UPI003AAF0BBB